MRSYEALMASRLITSTMTRRADIKTPVQQWGWAYLQRQKALGRPISPHLTVYQPQLTWMVGVLSSLFQISVCVGFAMLPFNFTQFVEYIRSWHIPAIITSAFKFVIAFPIVFHTLNGIRFIGFDLAKGVENTKAVSDSYLLFTTFCLISIAILLLFALLGYLSAPSRSSTFLETFLETVVKHV
ncbi:unnamed protein product [Heligmosomoides polygyrus]|uniref:Succinate dehydrogenase cytochrome b560 subunit, mitochondrial n=1 Tax=Heligmosomoides polygyrus TaxID=6339 RepID=A0A183FYE5_HELPZ|nr:unnamed protein product [Heligmosomoides polygyrus]